MQVNLTSLGSILETAFFPQMQILGQDYVQRCGDGQQKNSALQGNTAQLSKAQLHVNESIPCRGRA